MVELDFSLEPSEMRRIELANLETLTRTELDFYFFCGNIIFRVHDVIFDAPWGWVPIFNFAFQLFEIASKLGDGSTRVLEFTESDAAITFRPSGSTVCVTANYARGSANVSIDVLRSRAKEFLHRVLDTLIARWPALARNPVIRSTLEQIRREKI